MADTDSRKRRASGFRSAQSASSGPIGPGGPTRPGGARPSRGPSGSTRPSSGPSLGSAGRLPVRGGGASRPTAAPSPTSPEAANAGLSPEQEAHFQQLDQQAQADHTANARQTGTNNEEADAAATARQATNRNRDWAGQQTGAGDANTASSMGSTVPPQAPGHAAQPSGQNPSTPNGSDTPQDTPSAAQPSTKPSPRQLFANNLKRNRKKYLAGGGILGLILSLIFGFLALLPLKLESYMKNVIEKRIENRVYHYIEKRSDTMLAKFLNASVGEDGTTFEHNIVNTGQPLKDLYRTWRLNNFEAKLNDSQGIRFQRGTASGSVDVYKDGNLVGNYTGSEARALIRQAARDQTKWFQFILRRHLRQWMRNAYGVTRWSFFKRIFNSKDNPTAAVDEVEGGLVDNASQPAARTIGNLLKCILSLGAACTTDVNNPDVADRNGQLDVQNSETGNSQDGTIESDVSDGETTAADKAKAYLHSAATKFGSSDASSKVLGRILSKYFSDQVTQDIIQLVAAAKGPLIIISLVDIGSRIDHFLYNGAADKALVSAHQDQYANEFANFSTIDDNWKAGQVTGDEVNATGAQLSGIEQSQAFQDLYLNNTSGRPLDTVDDGNGGTKTDTFSRSIDEHYQPIENFYRQVFGDTPLPWAPATTWHQFFVGWYYTAGQIWGFINSIIGDLFGAFFKLIEAVFPPLRIGWDWLTGNVSNWIVDLVLWVAGLAVDGTERGADLANGIDAGGVVTGIGFARDLGAPQISPTAAAQLDQTIAGENQHAADQLSIKDRIFSTDYNHSLVNTLAAAAPGSPDEAVHDSLSYYAALTMNPFKAFSPLLKWFGVHDASAAADDSADNLYGMYDWGYTDAQLDVDDTTQLNQAWQTASTRTGKPIAPATDTNPDPATYLTANDLELEDCPKVADETKDPNVCRLDIATIQALEANSTGADNGGLNSGGGN